MIAPVSPTSAAFDRRSPTFLTSARAALIGPGVDSSNHYERTHHDALLVTTQWVLAYLLAD